jgi:hypothetical protein
VSDKQPLIRSESDNSYIQQQPSSTKKQVRFSAAVRVVLIPTVAEYRQVGLADLMWWSDCHYSEFKTSAVNELKEYMTKHTGSNAKEAIKALYQPFNSETKLQQTAAIFSAEVSSPQPHVLSSTTSSSQTSSGSGSDKCDPLCVTDETPRQFHLLHADMKANSFRSPVIPPCTPPAAATRREAVLAASGGSPTCVAICIYQHSSAQASKRSSEAVKLTSPCTVPSVLTAGKSFGSLLSNGSLLRPAPVDTRRPHATRCGKTEAKAARSLRW